MSTITSPSIIAEMLQNNGVFNGDPPAVAIFSYVHRMHKEQPHFAVYYNPQHITMGVSEYIESYKLLLLDGVCTLDGVEWLKKYKKKGQLSRST